MLDCSAGRRWLMLALDLSASCVQAEGQTGLSASLRPTPTPNVVEQVTGSVLSSVAGLHVSYLCFKGQSITRPLRYIAGVFPLVVPSHGAKKPIFFVSLFRAIPLPCLRSLVKTVGCGAVCGLVEGLYKVSRYGTLAPEREKQNVASLMHLTMSIVLVSMAMCDFWGRGTSISRPLRCIDAFHSSLLLFFKLLVAVR